MTELLAARVLAVPDHPQPGIVFRDVTPLLADAGAFRARRAAYTGRRPLPETRG